MSFKILWFWLCYVLAIHINLDLILSLCVPNVIWLQLITTCVMPPGEDLHTPFHLLLLYTPSKHLKLSYKLGSFLRSSLAFALRALEHDLQWDSASSSAAASNTVYSIVSSGVYEGAHHDQVMGRFLFYFLEISDDCVVKDCERPLLHHTKTLSPSLFLFCLVWFGLLLTTLCLLYSVPFRGNHLAEIPDLQAWSGLVQVLYWEKKESHQQVVIIINTE